MAASSACAASVRSTPERRVRLYPAIPHIVRTLILGIKTDAGRASLPTSRPPYNFRARCSAPASLGRGTGPGTYQVPGSREVVAGDRHVPGPGCRLRISDCRHLVQGRQALEGLDLDLAHALAGQAEPAADLLERLRLRVVEAVAEHDDEPVALRQGTECLGERLRAERVLDELVGERVVAGDEVAEHGVLGVPDGRVQRRGRPRGRLHLARLLHG